MEKMTVNELCDFFRDNPRETWREEIEKRIQSVDAEWGITVLGGIIDDEEGWRCNFLPEMLDPGYRFFYDIGDIVRIKGREGIFIIIEYPLLDERRTCCKEFYDVIDFYGSCYDIIGVDKGVMCGADKGIDGIPFDSCVEAIMTPAENVQFEEGTFFKLAQRLIDPKTRDIAELNQLITFAYEHPEIDPMGHDFEQFYLLDRKE